MGTKTIVIDERWHASALTVAATKSIQLSKKVTIRDVVEQAMESCYGTLADIEQETAKLQVPVPRGAEWRHLVDTKDDEGLFARIMEATIIHHDTNDYIYDIPEDLKIYNNAGTMRFPVRALAFFFRSKWLQGRRIKDLYALMIAYQFNQ
jgi:hypothetical protein